MADGAGTFVGNRGNFQVGEYIFKMNDSSASTHNLEINDRFSDNVPISL